MDGVYHHHQHHHRHHHSQQFMKDELMIEDEDYRDNVMVSNDPDNSEHFMQQHQRGFICPLCSKVISSIGDMRIHLDQHYPRDSPMCPVLTCQKTFTHPNSVRNHMRIKHGDKWKEMKALRWTYV